MAREDIISTAGEVAKQISALNKWLEAAKEVLKQSMIAGGEIQVGDSLDIAGSNFWGATFSHRERTGIDLDRLKAEFGDAWIASRSKTTDYYEIRFKAVK